jgi:hypothetical protein
MSFPCHYALVSRGLRVETITRMSPHPINFPLPAPSDDDFWCDTHQRGTSTGQAESATSTDETFASVVVVQVALQYFVNTPMGLKAIRWQETHRRNRNTRFIIRVR